ncbi:hypothetical protein Dimus_025943 [Dionaea muscipula]
MLWKYLLFPRALYYILDAQSLGGALATSKSPIPCSTPKGRKLYSSYGKSSNDRPSKKSRVVRSSLSPDIVDSTLANCPSDLIALNFFLWCARQPNYFHGNAAMDRMVKVVVRLVDKFISIKGILRELESIGCVVKAQTFLLFLKIFWRGGMYNMVFDVLDEMTRFGYKWNEFAHFVKMDVLFRIGHADAALAILNEMPLPKFFDVALCNLCRSKDLVNLKMVVRVMLRKGLYPNDKTLVMILNWLCKECRMAEAFQVVGLMASLGIQVSLIVWSILVDGFCRAGRYTEAGSLLEKMIDVGFSPNVTTFTFLVKGLLESHMIDHAIRILDLMEYSQCEVDLVFFNVLIHCLMKMGGYDEALGVLFEMRRQNLEPDNFTFSSVLSALRVPRKFPLLMKLVVGSAISPDVVVYNSLLSFFCNAGLTTCALKSYGNMLDRGFMPDMYTYVGLLTALCQANRFREAVCIYSRVVMSHYSHVDAHVHTAILDGLVKAEKYEAAICLFKEALAAKYTLDVVSYTIAIIALVRSSKVWDAITLYNRMKELAVAPDRRICNTLIFGLCRESHLKLVIQILEEMLGAQIKLDFRTCLKIADLMFKSRSCREIFTLLIEMWESGLVPDNALLVLLVEGIGQGIQVDNTYLVSMIQYLGNDPFVELSSSEDQSGVMALAG